MAASSVDLNGPDPARLLARLGRTAAAADGGSWHPAGRWVTLDDRAVGPMRLHQVSLGQGPHVLLLHGFVQSSWAWRLNLERLAAHFTVHALCVPGFGWSDKPLSAPWRLADQAERVVALLDVLGITRCHLIGNSLGASLALRVALLRPDQIAAMVLINPAAVGVYPALLAAALQHPAWAPLFGLPAVPWGLRQTLRLTAYRQLAVDRHYMHHFLLPLRSPGAREAALAVARWYGRDLRALRDRLGDVRQPCLVVDGLRDGIVPRSAVARVATALPGAQLLRFERSGHCPMEDEPERFDAAALDFLRRHLKQP